MTVTVTVEDWWCVEGKVWWDLIGELLIDEIKFELNVSESLLVLLLLLQLWKLMWLVFAMVVMVLELGEVLLLLLEFVSIVWIWFKVLWIILVLEVL